ncbi:MAG: DNA recombination protein RmuC [candidate division WOR-3 bacterium]|nr:DNA recombination protein RmuC [candidate division WOR-3 bacterium]MDH7518901.1 DNA recombination protein RmuC [bacterium]
MVFVYIAAALALIISIVVLFLNLSRSRAPAGELHLLLQQLEALRQQQIQALDNNTQLLNQRLSEINRLLAENTGQINSRLDNAARMVSDVSRALGELSQASQQIYEIGKNIASLQEILRAPKPRGVLGELFLGNLLQEMVPNNYELQYRFRSGVKVDAVVRLGQRLVPIDAKFPLENFQRLLTAPDDNSRRSLRKQFLNDIKKHIDSIADKYILPDEGTFDFALMYIPAENVYYETIVANPTEEKETILDYAFSRRVIPVSPGTIYAYLQTLILGLRGLEIDRKAIEILDHLNRLQAEISRFRDKFETIGSHLTNAHNRYEEAARELVRLTEKVAINIDEKISTGGQK